MKNDLEHVRIEILRNEIAQRNLELSSLESIAKQLPGGQQPDRYSQTYSSPNSSALSSATNSPNLLSTPEFTQPLLEKAFNYTDGSINKSEQRYSSNFFSSESRGHLITYSMNGGQTSNTTRVIDALQSTIDSLKRELEAQSERIKEERRTREAVQRKYESFTEQADRIRHENDMFNNILRRKDRKVEELQARAKSDGEQLEAAGNEIATLKAKVIELELSSAKEHEMRIQAETSYDALATSSRQSSTRLREELGLMKSNMRQIVEQRREDVASIAKLDGSLAVMAKEKERLVQNHLDTVEASTAQLAEVKLALQELQLKVKRNMRKSSGLDKDLKSEVQHVQWMRKNSSTFGEDV
ncbi:uncharacterized protein V1518DRAFT_390012 [Limtongia smithiae]|uniref:uncharacterized protein n=1 Tax=Limtongia smithiae TaxID=1125753 RepID=UPI0034CF897A